MTVYIVGRMTAHEGGVKDWDLQGVFDSREKAVAACTRFEDFVGPVEVNRDLGDEIVTWPGQFWPMTEAHEAGQCLPNCPCKQWAVEPAV